LTSDGRLRLCVQRQVPVVTSHGLRESVALTVPSIDGEYLPQLQRSTGLVLLELLTLLHYGNVQVYVNLFKRISIANSSITKEM